MISVNDMIKAIENFDDLVYDKERKMVIDTNDNHDLCTIEEFTQKVCQEMGCDFECIYSDALLNTIYRCKHCGTVMFTGDDERWEPKLRCPVCSDYKPHCSYWTGEEIAQDKKKQEEIQAYIEMDKMMQERNEWYEKRKEKLKAKGKNSWYYNIFEDIYILRFKIKKNTFKFRLSALDLYNTKLKGLHLNLACASPSEDNELAFSTKWDIRIPISPYAIYLFWIFPHTKKYKLMMEM